MIDIYYILDKDGNVHEEHDSKKYYEWMITDFDNVRQVAETIIVDNWISTIFLPISYQFDRNSPPILFETMIFGIKDNIDEYCERYVTKQEALIGHSKAINYVLSNIEWFKERNITTWPIEDDALATEFKLRYL